MSRWWRAYDDAVDNEKLLLLPDRAHRAWFNLMCIASANGGVLPEMKVLALKLRMSSAKVEAIMTLLVDAKLFDRDENGLAPHNWQSRQFLSDSSSTRVKRHRDKRAAAGLVSQWSASRELRAEIYLRDGHACIYCSATDDLTIDHKVPEARGGTHDATNLQTACRKCNASKRDLTHDEYVSRNGRETLLKRPQSTEHRAEPEKKEDAAGAAPDELERQLFERGKQVLGKDAGGLIAKLLKAKQRNVALARAAIEQAATKSKPREYIGAVIAGGEPTGDGKRLTNDEAYWGVGRIPGIV